jgi:hypothetical protein
VDNFVHLLKRLQASRHRNWFAAGIAIVVGLLVVLPQADAYFAMRSRRQTLADEATRFQAERDGLPIVQDLAAKKLAELNDLAGQSVAADQVHVFRGRVVELARQSSCQVRHIVLGERRQREWRAGDSPLATIDRPAQEARSPYRLGVQTMNISVSGSLAGAKEFLKSLRAEDRMIHTKRISLQPAAKPTEVVLEIELFLFELSYEKPPSV